MTSKPPSVLKAAGRQLWKAVVDDFELDGHQIVLLEAACRHADRHAQAQKILDEEGVVMRDRFDQPKAHPAWGVARDAAVAMARCVRELGLDVDGGVDDVRPPRVRPLRSVK